MEDGVSESKVTKDESQVSRDLKPNIEIDYEDNSDKIQIILNSYIQTTATTTTNNKTTTNTMSKQKCTLKKIIKWSIIILGIVVVLVIPFYIAYKILTKKIVLMNQNEIMIFLAYHFLILNMILIKQIL